MIGALVALWLPSTMRGMSNWKSQQVLIVGGGIGGLAAALALARKGCRVQVIEQAAEFKEIGAGIQLGPNVFRMFEVLGLDRCGQPRSRCFPKT